MYYVIEHNIRPDGVVNTSETGRSTFALALSYFFERSMKMVATELFISSHLLLVDDSLNVLKSEHIEGQYKAPTPEPEVEESAE